VCLRSVEQGQVYRRFSELAALFKSFPYLPVSRVNSVPVVSAGLPDQPDDRLYPLCSDTVFMDEIFIIGAAGGKQIPDKLIQLVIDIFDLHSPHVVELRVIISL
jgi:hypothetical protein